MAENEENISEIKPKMCVSFLGNVLFLFFACFVHGACRVLSRFAWEGENPACVVENPAREGENPAREVRGRRSALEMSGPLGSIIHRNARARGASLSLCGAKKALPTPFSRAHNGLPQCVQPPPQGKRCALRPVMPLNGYFCRIYLPKIGHSKFFCDFFAEMFGMRGKLLYLCIRNRDARQLAVLTRANTDEH